MKMARYLGESVASSKRATSEPLSGGTESGQASGFVQQVYSDFLLRVYQDGGERKWCFKYLRTCDDLRFCGRRDSFLM